MSPDKMKNTLNLFSYHGLHHSTLLEYAYHFILNMFYGETSLHFWGILCENRQMEEKYLVVQFFYKQKSSTSNPGTMLGILLKQI